MANLAWAIERIVPGADGRPVDRFEAYQEKRRAEPPPEPIPEGASVEYRLASTIPDHWIPLVPVHIGQDQRTIALQRGAMLDPETGGSIPQATWEDPLSRRCHSGWFTPPSDQNPQQG